MRRAAASILVTLGLLAAGLAWWAYAARYTVLDPARSERIAETIIEQPVMPTVPWLIRGPWRR